MSKLLYTLEGTGRNNVDLDVTEFAGPDGPMLQLTQGFGIEPDEPKFIQLSRKDALSLIEKLADWINKE